MSGYPNAVCIICVFAVVEVQIKADLLGRRPQVKHWPFCPRHPSAVVLPVLWAELTAWSETRGRNNSSRTPPPSPCQTHHHSFYIILTDDDHVNRAEMHTVWPRQKVTDCLGTRSKRMRLRSWSSSSITAASEYICSMSKWNWTPAGGSRKKFLLS